MKLTISRTARDAIIAHCAAGIGIEACGLLLGSANRVDAIASSENVAENPSRVFEIDPTVLFAALREQREGGPKLLGHYHSHPSGDLAPSEADAAMAHDTERYWIIVANGEMAAWYVPVPHRFAAVELCLASALGEDQ